MIEVELKFKMPWETRTQLLATLATWPSVEQLGQKENTDIYYDTPRFDCLQQAVFLRVRNYAQLDIKYHEQADPGHVYCTEQIFPLPLDQSQIEAMNSLCARFLPSWRQAEHIEEVFHINGLVAFTHLRNQRLRYMYKDLTLCVDHVEGLGNFFEVEISCQHEDEVGEAQAALHDFVSSLALPSLSPVKVGYVELWLRLHLPQVYQLGIYRAEEAL